MNAVHSAEMTLHNVGKRCRGKHGEACLTRVCFPLMIYD
jgi:hypothetical protein